MLAETDDPAEFRRLFERYFEHFNFSSTSSNKYKPLEQKLSAVTGWRPAAMKYTSDAKNLKNRIGEVRNLPGKPVHAIIFVPEKLAGGAQKAANELVVDGEFRAIGISASDVKPAAIQALIYDVRTVTPEPIAAAFPALQLVPVESAVAGEIIERGAVSLGSCAAETGVDEAVLQGWLTRLQRKKHLVFQGPPGTGKTFIAKRLAKLLAAESAGLVDIVQFHPSYSYEDFVQGIRAQLVAGSVTYELQDGRFLKFCTAARKQPTQTFVLIIDEMNRGNLSRIFGELLYLLEYRDQSIELSQGGKPFSIPSNVFLIGTMNTADRSIALVDHAIRRRFSFVFLGPDYEVLQKHLLAHGLPASSLIEVLRKLNASIGDKNYQLGTSFFLGAALERRESLQHIWEGEIEPYLEEYFFDQPARIDEYRWARLAASELAAWVDPTA
ncbi:McrB family protein [Steroidobacter flavus]|uniref:McrB family protein n=1 Tax=Steroidobacter flavus TaxID=1842136 RepID=A0ABV8T292_9GAMM